MSFRVLSFIIAITLASIALEGDAAIDLVPQLGHGLPIPSLAFSPDGRLVLTGGGDWMVRLWEATTGREIRQFAGNGDIVYSVAFRDGGRTAIATSAQDVLGWDIRTGKEVYRWRYPDAKAELHLSPDGLYLIVVWHDRGIAVVDLGTHTELWRLAPASKRSFVFAGSNMLLVDDEKEKSWYDLQSGRKLNSARIDGVALATARCGTEGLIVTMNGQGPPVLSRFPSGQRIATLDGADKQPSIAVSPDCQYVLSTTDTGAVRVWDAHGSAVHELSSGPMDLAFGSMSFSSDSKRVLFGTFNAMDGVAHIWDIAKGVEVQRFEGRIEEAEVVSCSAEGAITATRAINFWDFGSGRVTRRIGVGLHSAITMSKDGHTAFVGTPVGEVHIVDVGSGHATGTISGSNGWIQAIAVSPGGDRLLTGSSGDGASARLWNIQSRTLLRTLQGISGDVFSVAFLPDGRRMLTGDSNGSIRVWDTDTGREIKKLVQGSEWITQVIPFGDGHHCFTSSTDKSIRRWDLDSGKEVWRLGAGSPAFSIALSPDGKQIAAGTYDGTVIIADTASGKEVRRLSAHHSQVKSLAFSKEGRLLMTGSAEGTARLWWTDTGDEVATLMTPPDGSWLVVGLDGRFDSNNLEDIDSLHWLTSDAPLAPLPIEIFMRDYYYPRLLVSKLARAPLAEVVPIGNLNRAQPRLKIVEIAPTVDPDVMEVTVAFGKGTAEFERNGQNVKQETGVYDLHLFRNGRLVGQWPRSEQPYVPQNRDEWRRTTSIPLDQKTGVATQKFEVRLRGGRDKKAPIVLSAYAFNEDRVKSATTYTRFVTEEAPSGRRGTAYVITMGVNAAQDPTWDLWFAAPGAREMQRYLKDNLASDSRYQRVVPVTLVSDYAPGGKAIAESSATKQNLREVLAALAGQANSRTASSVATDIKRAGPDDTVVLYISSHGYLDPTGRFYLVTYETGPPAGISEESLDKCLTTAGAPRCEQARDFLKRAVSSEELASWLHDVDAGTIVLILDSCHSGGAAGKDFRPGPMGDRSLGQLTYDKGMLLLSATQADNVARGPLRIGQSLLTYSLLHPATQRRFAMRSWLTQAEEQVPRLYTKYYPEFHASTQKPAFLDFLPGDDDADSEEQ